MSDEATELPPEEQAAADAALGDAQFKLPVLFATGVGLRIDKFPEGQVLMIGPFALGLPLNEENVEWLKRELSGSQIIVPAGGAMAIPKSRNA